ncbi:mechanosensitive ion channel [Blastococcus sp. BMG 814]|uniref:Mechanosensitive ion channel n=1 Tax=Blastococcus carthaginiensis TaxID=3050034 RepID=A0ABT9IFJ1_9ACTN|nr:mechanosensitive ion channel domain-containing protein [Blastococcus carthaginiensis]MDP5184371.1 mechanosensitive ion channel [Blastococcus carthaginiensis]
MVRRVGRGSPVTADLSRRGRTPLRALLVLVALTVVLEAADDLGDWTEVVVHVLAPAVIATIGWLVAVAVFVAADAWLARYDVDVADNRHARRVRTQISLLRRLAVVLVAVLTLAAMLLTFPGARAAGASILASAGVISIVAGLAAQTSLANVFAGLQLAFTDAIRVDDVVVVEEEWGRIEEITLTYVVVHLWDDRRLVLPSTYFTTTPFENWTRKESAVLGAIELDVDWTTPFDRMREELDRLVAGDENWDERVKVLQVTDAVGSLVRVRVLVSAQDAGTLWDLRCAVREGLVGWLQREAPHALPRVRNEGAPGYETAGRRGPRPAPDPRTAPRPARPADRGPATNEGLFTGSLEARRRSQAFTGPSEEDRAERARNDRAAADGGTAEQKPAPPAP